MKENGQIIFSCTILFSLKYIGTVRPLQFQLDASFCVISILNEIR